MNGTTTHRAQKIKTCPRKTLFLARRTAPIYEISDNRPRKGPDNIFARHRKESATTFPAITRTNESAGTSPKTPSAPTNTPLKDTRKWIPTQIPPPQQTNGASLCTTQQARYHPKVSFSELRAASSFCAFLRISSSAMRRYAVLRDCRHHSEKIEKASKVVITKNTGPTDEYYDMVQNKKLLRLSILYLRTVRQPNHQPTTSVQDDRFLLRTIQPYGRWSTNRIWTISINENRKHRSKQYNKCSKPWSKKDQCDSIFWLRETGEHLFTTCVGSH